MVLSPATQLFDDRKRSERWVAESQRSCDETPADAQNDRVTLADSNESVRQRVDELCHATAIHVRCCPIELTVAMLQKGNRDRVNAVPEQRLQVM